MGGTASGSPVTPLTGMTRIEIATAVRTYLNEIGSTLMSGTVINNQINASCRKLNTDTDWNRQEYQITLTTSVQKYDIRGDMETIYRVTHGASRKRLDETSIAMLDIEDSDWESATAGTPTQFAVDGMNIFLIPKPDCSGTIYVWGTQTPADMTTHTAVPTWCPTRFHDTIAKLTAIDLATSQMADGQDVSNTRLQRLYTDYVQEVKQLRDLLNNRQINRVGRIIPTGYSTYRRRV